MVNLSRRLIGAAVVLVLAASGCSDSGAVRPDGPGPAPATAPVAVTGTTAVPSAVPAERPSSAAPSRPVAADQARDAFLRPFSSRSVWNTAIGADARYSSVYIGSSGIGADIIYVAKVRSTDPVVPSYDADDWAGVRCAGRKVQPQARYHPGLTTVRVPRDLTIPDADTDPQHYSTPNSKLTLVMPDGHTVRQFLPACRTAPGGPLYGYAFPPQDLRGDGLCCGHGASSLSSLGGVLRAGELTGSEPIGHALAVNLWGRYLYFDHRTGSGHVWPASMNDGAAPTTYQGTDPALRMGTLLAIPPSVTADQLHLRTAAGRKLFRAMQDYGLYVVEDTGQNTQELDIERSALTEIQRTITGGRPLYQYAPLAGDFTTLMHQVRAVTNNAPSAVGGGGRRRAPQPKELS